MTKIGLISDTHGFLDETISGILNIVMKYGMQAISAIMLWQMRLKPLSH
jgi:hypothetical protein